jgi:hypothetical protein
LSLSSEFCKDDDDDHDDDDDDDDDFVKPILMGYLII